MKTPALCKVPFWKKSRKNRPKWPFFKNLNLFAVFLDFLGNGTSQRAGVFCIVISASTRFIWAIKHPCTMIFISPNRPSGPSWSSSRDVRPFSVPFSCNFFEASHWPSDHMITSRPLIGQPSFTTKLSFFRIFFHHKRDPTLAKSHFLNTMRNPFFKRHF